MMIVSRHRHWGNQGGTYKNCGQNKKTTHIVNLQLEQKARHKPFHSTQDEAP